MLVNTLSMEFRPKRMENAAMPNRIAEIRKAQGITQEQIAQQLGTTNQNVSLIERGKRKLSEDWMRAFATALGVDPADLLAEPSERENSAYDTTSHHPPKRIRLPQLKSFRVEIRGFVQADAVRGDMFGNNKHARTYFEGVPLDPEFPHAERFILRMAEDDDSYNDVVLPKDLCVFAEFSEIGREPRHKDAVLVVRERAGGYETLIREYRVGQTKAELWPRSTNPKWQPIEYDPTDPSVTLHSLLLFVVRNPRDL